MGRKMGNLGPAKMAPHGADESVNSMPHEVTLYTRQGCHLCDDALALLVEFGLEPQTIDIDASPELRNRFDTCVPVVEIDGKIRFRGRVDPVLLRRLLR